MGGLQTPKIINFTLPLAGTEYNVLVPMASKKFIIKIRGDGAKVNLAFAAGETLAKYFTLGLGNFYEETGLQLTTDLAVYVQSNKPNQVLEILTWE